MQANTSNEFVELKVLHDEKANEFEAWKWYAAQIAMEIVQGRTKKRLRIEDYLIKFVSKEPTPTPEEIKQRIQTSKNYWSALVQIATRNQKAEKKPLPPPVRRKKK